MQKVVPDTNAIIGWLERPGLANQIRRQLQGKPYRIVLCRQVLYELRRVKAWTKENITTKLQKIFGRRRVEYAVDPDGLELKAELLREQHALAHRGDDRILALCHMLGMELVTFDRGMLKVANAAGILAHSGKHVR